MKVLVVGTGSIGKRHISNLERFGVDVYAYSYRAAKNPLSVSHPEVRLVNNLGDALEADFDAVVIANRTDLHMEIALKAAQARKNFFIEKPISVSLAGAEELLMLVERNKLVVEAGFMLRCHPNLLWIKEYLANNSLGDLMHLRASVGQWLPDWRPQTDHRTGYSAFRKTGGGVIFEMDDHSARLRTLIKDLGLAFINARAPIVHRENPQSYSVGNHTNILGALGGKPVAPVEMGLIGANGAMHNGFSR